MTPQATVERRNRAFCHGGDHDLGFRPSRRCSLDASSRGCIIGAGPERSGWPSIFAPIRRKEPGPFAKRLNS
jgi:hypothetical protein